MKLSEFIQGRDNNFNFIRIVAALSVLVTHSFALVIGKSEAEPFQNTLGMTIGTIAVDVFFIASGFLVTSSLLNRKSVIEFFWARALRIFPALIVMLLLTVFILGVFFTSLPISRYFQMKETYVYFIKCSTLIMGIEYTLPGVFNNNPYKDAVNGSLWTMPREVLMYTILVLVWIASLITKSLQLRLFKGIIITFTLTAAIYIFVSHFYFLPTNNFTRLFFMFFMGATFYVLSKYIVLSHWIFWFFVTSLLMATINKQAFFIVYIFVIAYILFYVAYIPSGLIRKYNYIGDYSYGIYIYAFPVQQSIAALIPEVSVAQMVLFSSIVTILFAVISWHLLEKRVISLRGYCVNHTKKFFAGSLRNALARPS